MRTQVAIIGAGPSGLLLSHLLAARGIDTVVLETRSQEYVLARIRAGILEQSSVDVLRAAGLGDRLDAEAMPHRGIYLQWPGERHHLDFADLIGRRVFVYGQTELTKDLVTARERDDQHLVYGVSDVALHDLESDRPSVSYVDSGGVRERLEAAVVVGCDGSFGPSRRTIPASESSTWERTYPYAWLGVLADVAPSTDELIYAWHPDGFAMHSMRSHEVSRFYLQVRPDEDVDQWSDDRIWGALSVRLGAGLDWTLATGPIRDKSVLPMRSHVSSPMRHHNLFLAGDAAHIVPPTGAKGLNLAIADVALLAPALAELLRGEPRPAEDYTSKALRRVWRCTHFSWWMTTMLHISHDDFDAQLQLSQLRWVVDSTAGAAGLAENYAGLPLEM
ncbi:MAG: 4-hydroxybenzoate 3-monooxygenase [Nocardioides sp.]